MVTLVITGNPGVGKHTSTKFVAQKIRETKIIDINELVIAKNVILEKDTKFGIEVDVKKLSGLIAHEITKTMKTRKTASQRNLVIVGHLAPYVLKPSEVDLVFVLRRSPYEIIKTFELRKYSLEKIKENVASEILDVCLYDALKRFGKNKIVELDTTGKTPEYIADEIILSIKQQRIGITKIVDWLSLIYKKGDLQNFFAY
jgi:adenylate kinase